MSTQLKLMHTCALTRRIDPPSRPLGVDMKPRRKDSKRAARIIYEELWCLTEELWFLGVPLLRKSSTGVRPDVTMHAAMFLTFFFIFL